MNDSDSETNQFNTPIKDILSQPEVSLKPHLKGEMMSSGSIFHSSHEAFKTLTQKEQLVPEVLASK
jgi:hypothetical protein